MAPETTRAGVPRGDCSDGHCASSSERKRSQVHEDPPRRARMRSCRFRPARRRPRRRTGEGRRRCCRRHLPRRQLRGAVRLDPRRRLRRLRPPRPVGQEHGLLRRAVARVGTGARRQGRRRQHRGAGVRRPLHPAGRALPPDGSAGLRGHGWCDQREEPDDVGHPQPLVAVVLVDERRRLDLPGRVRLPLLRLLRAPERRRAQAGLRAPARRPRRARPRATSTRSSAARWARARPTTAARRASPTPTPITTCR